MLDFLLRDAYYDRWGPGSFYTQQEAFNAYDARLSYILNYKGKYSGMVWKNWPQAIFSFNLQVRRPPISQPCRNHITEERNPAVSNNDQLIRSCSRTSP